MITNITFGYTPIETKDQLLERLIKENKITFNEAMLLAEKELISFVQPYSYPVIPNEPWTYPFQPTCY